MFYLRRREKKEERAFRFSIFRISKFQIYFNFVAFLAFVVYLQQQNVSLVIE